MYWKVTYQEATSVYLCAQVMFRCNMSGTAALSVSHGCSLTSENLGSLATTLMMPGLPGRATVFYSHMNSGVVKNRIITWNLGKHCYVTLNEGFMLSGRRLLPRIL